MEPTPPPAVAYPPPPYPPAGAPPPPAVARPRRAPAGSAWLLRIATTVLALATIAQPLLIGRYLDGDYDAIGLHSANAILLVLLATGVGVVALVWWLSGGTPWPFLCLVLLWFLIGFQLGMGYARNLTIHIPLGVAIVTSTVVLAVWSWTGDVFRRRAR